MTSRRGMYAGRTLVVQLYSWSCTRPSASLRRLYCLLPWHTSCCDDRVDALGTGQSLCQPGRHAGLALHPGCVPLSSSSTSHWGLFTHCCWRSI